MQVIRDSQIVEVEISRFNDVKSKEDKRQLLNFCIRNKEIMQEFLKSQFINFNIEKLVKPSTRRRRYRSFEITTYKLISKVYIDVLKRNHLKTREFSFLDLFYTVFGREKFIELTKQHSLMMVSTQENQSILKSIYKAFFTEKYVPGKYVVTLYVTNTYGKRISKRCRLLSIKGNYIEVTRYDDKKANDNDNPTVKLSFNKTMLKEVKVNIIDGAYNLPYKLTTVKGFYRVKLQQCVSQHLPSSLSKIVQSYII